MNSNQLLNKDEKSYHTFKVIENYKSSILGMLDRIEPKNNVAFFNDYRKKLNKHKVFFILNKPAKSATAGPAVYKYGGGAGTYQAFDENITIEEIIDNLNDYLYLGKNYNLFIKIVKESIDPKYIEKEERVREKILINYNKKAEDFIKEVRESLKHHFKNKDNVVLLSEGEGLTADLRFLKNKQAIKIDDFFERRVVDYNYQLFYNLGFTEEAGQLYKDRAKARADGKWEKLSKLESIFIDETQDWLGIDEEGKLIKNRLVLSKDKIKENNIYVVLFSEGFMMNNGWAKMNITKARIFSSIDEAVQMAEYFKGNYARNKYQVIKINMRVAEIAVNNGNISGVGANG